MVGPVPALLLFALLSAAPPAEPESVNEGAIEGPVAPAKPETAPETAPNPAPAEPPASELPPPILTPEGTTPPGEQAGPEVPEVDEEEDTRGSLTFADPKPEPAPPPPEPEPEDFDYEQRSFEDMPYAPTAARRSAVQRNNDVLVRSFRAPIYAIAAVGRFATSLLGARDVIQPFGYGVAAELRINFLRVFKSRFGIDVYAGYTRFQERVDYPAVEGVSAEITRLNLLAHTDVSAGPSLQIPIGPVFLQFGASAGVAFSTLTRTQSVEAIDDELIISTDALLRGGLSLGVPVYSRHGLTLGAAVQHVFSRDQVAEDLADPDGPKAQPFGTWLEINLGYQMWF
jgi:hypothetical protein